MTDIKVSPALLDAQGKALIDFAGELDGILNKINGKINEISEGWSGLAEQGYLEMYEKMKESLNKFPELVNSLGDATVKSAEAFSSVDETLQNSFTKNA